MGAEGAEEVEEAEGAEGVKKSDLIFNYVDLVSSKIPFIFGRKVIFLKRTYLFFYASQRNRLDNPKSFINLSTISFPPLSVLNCRSSRKNLRHLFPPQPDFRYFRWLDSPNF